MTQEPAFDFSEIVSIAVKVMTGMGFSAGEQIQVMGGPGPFNGTQDDVPDYLERMSHRTVFARCEMLFPIALILAALFEDRQPEMRKWLRVKHPDFGGESMHSLLTSGRPSDMDRALDLARKAQG